MTGLAFYKELSQVVKHVGQGHLSVTPSLPRFNKKEKQALDKKGKSPFSQFDFETLEHRLFYRDTFKKATKFNVIKSSLYIHITHIYYLGYYLPFPL